MARVKSACQQHLDVFTEMKTNVQVLEENMAHESIAKTYFELNTHQPKKNPKILNYKRNSKTKGFELIVMGCSALFISISIRFAVNTNIASPIIW